MEIFIPILILLSLAILFLVVRFAVESIKTTYWLNKNQKAWNEYSRGLTYEQKLNIFPEWLEEQRRINGTDYYYIPRM